MRKWVGIIVTLVVVATLHAVASQATAADDPKQIAFFEKKIRPLLSKHCYRCHSEAAKRTRGGLLLDRKSGWIKGGDTGKAVVPGQPDASLLIKAVRYVDEDMQMPPSEKLSDDEIRLLEIWVRNGAQGPDDPPASKFSRLGDQDYLLAQSKTHWAYQKVVVVDPPAASTPAWNGSKIDRFVHAGLQSNKLTPSQPADARTLIRRLSFDLTGLPPTPVEVDAFVAAAKQDRQAAIRSAVDRLIASPAFGEHFGRMWLDVARYADTDSFYRPDTRTPHYFPYAFTYRDYVIQSLNKDKPYDQLLREQLAADLLGFKEGSAELAALGFLTVGPHANRSPKEALDDWIDVTTRGLMGLTVACARCHDHKFEAVPTKDYYSLRGVFDSIVRVHPLDEKNQPLVPGYEPSAADRADFAKQRAKIEAKIKKVGGARAKNNNKSEAEKIRETELAELLLFHPGAPARTMVVKEKGRPVEPIVYIRGDPANRGEKVSRHFLSILDAELKPFGNDTSGRLELAEHIVSPGNPLTARVFVNRVWGTLLGSYLVPTPSDFGLQGERPTHPQLLDFLAADFVSHGWSLKHLVRSIVLSQTYQQSSSHRPDMAAIDPGNKQLWRANRKHLPIESLRDGMLAVAGQLDHERGGHAGQLWGKDYSHRRTIYGYINRFNLDPTLRTFDFPTPMQTQANRGESIVPTQALFAMNAPFVVDQAIALTESKAFREAKSDEERVEVLCRAVFQRSSSRAETKRIAGFVGTQQRFFDGPLPKGLANTRVRSPWPLVAQALMMSNEFQYVD